jgi:eukaryotic-like serine/threonine-protein kinase
VARNSEGGIAVSPDGTMIAFAAPVGGRPLLWVRRLDSLDTRTLPGTDGAFQPFWSPDSKWIAFYTPEKLMKVAAAGGTPQTICRTDPRSTGGSWGSDDVLLVTTHRGELLRVSASDGVPVPLFAGLWPHFLPDGKRFLFQRNSEVWTGSLDASEQPRRLVEASATKPGFSSGHLLFLRNRTLMAHRFDPAARQVSGSAFPVVESITSPDPNGNPGEYSATRDGRLVYAAGGDLNKLVWRDRSGKVLDELVSGAEFATPRISPDGKRVAFARTDRENMDIWIAELDRTPAQMTHFTFDSRQDRYPIWSPDGATITFSSGETGSFELYRKPSNGTGNAEPLINTPSPQHAMDWSRDGKHLAFTRNQPNTDLLILPTGGSEYVFLQTKVSESHSQFNPGIPPRWIAYDSDDSGRREIYVKAFVPGQPAGDARWQISTDGGTMPRWRGDGRELYYWALDGKIMAAPIDGTGSAFQKSTPVVLFQVQPPTLRTNDINFDVTRDGQRFLFIEPVERVQSQPLTFVTDWLAATKRVPN